MQPPPTEAYLPGTVPVLSDRLLLTPYRDPLFDGATDPVLVADPTTRSWLLFYTQRRAALAGLGGVEWVHESEIGCARSYDGGETWAYEGVLDDVPTPGLDHPVTKWAPDVVRIGEHWVMFLTLLGGKRSDWSGNAVIAQYTSSDLKRWTFQAYVDLRSDRVIDAAVTLCGDGLYRLWYKDEQRGSRTFSAVTATPSDPRSWQVEGVAIDGRPHEGPKVFTLGGWFWLITDEWRGLAVYRSADGAGGWERQHRDNGLILTGPEEFEGRPVVARHADVVVQGAAAAVVYFTHPAWSGSELADMTSGTDHRRSHIRAAWFTVSPAGHLMPCWESAAQQPHSFGKAGA
ncbi:glycoside hydrolase [Arthrobacter agilis]|uniref:family 43 glycosylhydrolase n=1 Tax=Arthrobacter agilis TaxID=37921 RepID=UPI000F7F7775|nr:family 43 glycosylhydrolase [Arthrobacter agilis]TPV26441.1 glycoside hydrolase [Arthrobacter agilis]